MNIFKRIRNWYFDKKFAVNWPDIQDVVDRTNHENEVTKLIKAINERKKDKKKTSHLQARLVEIKAKALERGW